MDVNQLRLNSQRTEGGRARMQDTNSTEQWDQLQPAGHTSMSTKKCYLIFAKHWSNSSQGISGSITSEIARWRFNWAYHISSAASEMGNKIAWTSYVRSLFILCSSRVPMLVSLSRVGQETLMTEYLYAKRTVLKQDSDNLSEFSWRESLMKCMQMPSSNLEPVYDKITVNHQLREEELDYHLNTELNWQPTVCCRRVPLKISAFPCRCSSNGHQASCLYERQSHSKLPTITCSTCFTSHQVSTVEQRKTFKMYNLEGSPMRTL